MIHETNTNPWIWINRNWRDSSYTSRKIKRGLEIAQKESDYRFIVAGGNAPGKPNENQAKAMREWLISQSIPQDQIILEDQSISTVEQILYLHEHLVINKYDSVCIIGTAGGFDKRIELLVHFLFDEDPNIEVEGATLPQEISKNALYQFTVGEEERIQVLLKLTQDFHGNKVEKLKELTLKHRTGDLTYFSEIGYNLSSEQKEKPHS